MSNAEPRASNLVPMVLYYSASRSSRIIAEVRFTADWNETSVFFEGELVGVIPTSGEIAAGRDFDLPDGSVLHVVLSKERLPRAVLSVSGRRLHSWAFLPRTKVRVVAGVTWLTGAFYVLVGCLAVFTAFEFPRLFGATENTVVQGGLFLILAALIWRRSMLGLLVANAHLAADSAVWWWSQFVQGLPTPGLIMAGRSLAMLWLWSGVHSMRQWNDEVAHARVIKGGNSDAAGDPVNDS